MNIPANLKYSKDHEWLRIEDDIAYIGVTAYAAEQLGDIVFIDIISIDETLDKDEVFGSIEAVKTVSDLLLPIGGEVIEFNEKLEETPGLVNTDPYNEGWIIKIKPTDISEADALLSMEQYKEFLG